nr:uncharacterized protein LOC125969385 [Syngnathus scovelli]
MNFSKLLCLVLVYSQQFGQVLTAVQTSEDCQGTAGSTVTCKRKKGEKVSLTISTGATNTKWMKGTVDITAETDKREISDDVKKLTILNLAEGDEGEYTAGTSPEEKFQVQVVDCIGGNSAATPGLCQGKPGGRIKLALSDGTVSSIAWKKAMEKITANNKYPGGVDKATLTIMDLDDTDEAKFTGGQSGDGEHFSVQGLMLQESRSPHKSFLCTIS